MSALPGNHYCREHQGNSSHYDPQNCEMCNLLAALEAMLEAHKQLMHNLAHGVLGGSVIINEAPLLANKAIAKAKGDA